MRVGDEIRATINSLRQEADLLGALGVIYIVSFVLIFIYVLLAIVISITEKAYYDISYSIQERKRTMRGSRMIDLHLHQYNNESTSITRAYGAKGGRVRVNSDSVNDACCDQPTEDQASGGHRRKGSGESRESREREFQGRAGSQGYGSSGTTLGIQRRVRDASEA